MFEKGNSKVAQALAISTALTGATLPARDADAGAFLTGYDDSQHLALGAEYSGKTLHLNLTIGDFSQDASAVRLNENWALTASHLVGGSVRVAEPDELFLSNGPNYLTDPGDIFTVDEVIIHPLNDYSNLLNYPEIALLRGNFGPGEDLIIGQANVGDIVTGTGHGLYGSPGAINPQDGQMRGWRGVVENQEPLYLNPEYYQSSVFSDSNELLSNPVDGMIRRLVV